MNVVISTWSDKVIELKMWRVKTLNLGLSPSPQTVRRELPRTGRYLDGTVRWLVKSGSQRSGAVGGIVGPGLAVVGKTHPDPEPSFPHTRFLFQGKPAMRTPLQELKLQPEALADSGKVPSAFTSLTPYLRRLELKVRF